MASSQQSPYSALSELCTRLRDLHIEAGGPSVPSMAKRPKIPLGRTQIYDVLNGSIARVPSWDFIREFVAACAEYAAAHDRPLTTGTDLQQWRRDHAAAERSERDRHRAARPSTGVSPAGRAGPAIEQLPAPIAHFSGRERELAWLTDQDRATAGRTDRGATDAPVEISAIVGTAGIGKTALAVQWAHRVRDSYPDGRLYVDLRGYDEQRRVDPGEALAGFLLATGAAPRLLPAETDQRAAEFRSRTVGRRLLVLLDNAFNAEQVRPLLPGHTTCRVVVTSRDSLSGLVIVNGARRLTLDPLESDDAVLLLRQILGSRVDAEPDAAEQLAAQCCRMPLALRIAAQLATARPGASLSALVGELEDRRRRFALMSEPDDPRSAVRSVFSWSYQQLSDGDAQAFRRFGVHPGTMVTPRTLAALAEGTVTEARGRLAALERASLLQHAGGDAYTAHDLLREHARSLAEQTDSPQEMRRAWTRLYEFYLDAASHATEELYSPSGDTPSDDTPSDDTVIQDAAPEAFDPAAARAWLDAERGNLILTAAHATRHGAGQIAVELSGILWRYLQTGSHFEDALALYTQAWEAARKLDDGAAEARSLGNLATAYWDLGRNDEAAACIREALVIFRRLEDMAGESKAHNVLGAILEAQGGYDEAAACYDRSLALSRRTGQTTIEANALNNLGNIAYRRGRYAEAVEYHSAAITLYRTLGDRNREGISLLNAATVNRDRGRFTESLRQNEQALALFDAEASRSESACALAGIGVAEAALGDPVRGAGRVERALEICTEIGDVPGQGDRLAELGVILHQLDRRDEAVDRLQRALTIATDCATPRLALQALNGLGACSLSGGDAVAAGQYFQQAESTAEAIGDQYELAHGKYGLGQVLAAQDDVAGAARQWREALSLATDLGIPLADEVAAALAGLET